MHDLVLTGASRGIGHALASAIAGSCFEAKGAKGVGRPRRLWLVARDENRLRALAEETEAAGIETRIVPTDLGDLAAARALGERLAAAIGDDAVLVQNAGIWPSTRELSPEGWERAFLVNHAAPYALQAPLLEAKKLSRLLVISAGLLVKGHVDADRTPSGADFSAFRTYASTKLCFALATRDVAARHPEVDVAVVHPGVVETNLGARPGPLGWLLARVKRRWEAPAVCGARLARMLALPRWSSAGEAAWYFEAERRPWPAVADDPRERAAVRTIIARTAP